MLTSIDVAVRSTESELMDVETVTPEDLAHCLRDLSRVNQLTLAYGPTLRFMKGISTYASPRRPLQVLDVGCGYGDMLRQIEAWSEAASVPLVLTGVDMNPLATRAAQAATDGRSKIRFLTRNAFEFAREEEVDVVISSLFTHHLTDDELRAFVRWMDANAKRAWFINDLERSRLAFALFRPASRLLDMHRFVQHDGPVSIARSFTVKDWETHLRASGVTGARIRREFPYRITVEKQTAP
jgi:SAM-dependent methyltransferase